MSAGRRLSGAATCGHFGGKLVATVLSRAYNHPLESRPRPQVAFIWERSAEALDNSNAPLMGAFLSYFIDGRENGHRIVELGNLEPTAGGTS